MFFDWEKINVLVSNERPKAVSLSTESVVLALTAVLFLSDRWRWNNYSGDEDWDVIEGHIAILSEELMSSVFVGAIMPCAGDIPESGLLCNGDLYDKVDYPSLYEVIDSVYIVDADSFNVPDMRNRFVYGVGSNELGDEDGAETVTLTEAEMPRHNHSDNDFSTNIDVEGPGVPDPLAIGLPKLPFQRTGFTGGDGAHDNMPPFIALKYFIVAR